MVHNSIISTHWKPIFNRIMELEEKGLVTRTFRRLDKERQEIILKAILEEAIEKGPEAINIKEIANRADIAIGSLYQYFESREKLLEFTVELTVSLLCDLLANQSATVLEMPLREGLVYYLNASVEWGRSQTTLMRFFARAAYHGDGQYSNRIVGPIAEKLGRIIREMLVCAVKRGELRPDLDLDAATAMIHALTTAYGDAQLLPYINIYYRILDQSKTPEQRLEVFIDMVMQGIGNPAGKLKPPAKSKGNHPKVTHKA